MLKTITTKLLGLCLLAASTTASAGLVKFDFEFFDQNGVSFGDGYYMFDDIAPGNKASFQSLTNFSWAFEISSIGLSMSSAVGDVPSTDSLINEGILLSGSVGNRNLTFFDDTATYILHHDVSLPFPKGVEFQDINTAWVRYLPNNQSSFVGSFTATESTAVSAPATLFLVLLTGAAVMFRRKR